VFFVTSSGRYITSERSLSIVGRLHLLSQCDLPGGRPLYSRYRSDPNKLPEQHEQAIVQ
jgi:hypothetical protein